MKYLVLGLFILSSAFAQSLKTDISKERASFDVEITSSNGQQTYSTENKKDEAYVVDFYDRNYGLITQVEKFADQVDRLNKYHVTRGYWLNLKRKDHADQVHFLLKFNDSKSYNKPNIKISLVNKTTSGEQETLSELTIEHDQFLYNYDDLELKHFVYLFDKAVMSLK